MRWSSGSRESPSPRLTICSHTRNTTIGKKSNLALLFRGKCYYSEGLLVVMVLVDGIMVHGGVMVLYCLRIKVPRF